MMYKKPKIRYTDMCIYIDNIDFTKKYDEQKVFEYLYHIILMLSIKNKYSATLRERENFSAYAAGDYFMRLTNDKRFDSSSGMKPIKSILNYIKKTLYYTYIQYLNKYKEEPESNDTEYYPSASMDRIIGKSTDCISNCDFIMTLQDVCKSIKNFLKTIPYKYNSAEWHNIYISCLLSFLNGITLKNKDIIRINNFKYTGSCTDTLFEELYDKERKDEIILFHLDDSMYPYIKVLLNRIRHILSRELSYITDCYLTADESMKNLIISDYIDKEDM